MLNKYGLCPGLVDVKEEDIGCCCCGIQESGLIALPIGELMICPDCIESTLEPFVRMYKELGGRAGLFH